MIKFILPFNLPSLNVWERWHWTKRRKIKKQIGWFLKYGKITEPCKMKITITHYRHSLIKDDDNLIASGKPLLDALTAHALIFDDARDYVDVKHIQKIDRKNKRTEIEIEEV